jgi:sugar transferase (PEP-CTERM/EpsH1 system associated)
MRILFICHNTPYPPNKGEKIRTHAFIRKLAEKHEVEVLSLAKEVEDLKYLSEIEKFCMHAEIIPLSSWQSRFFSMCCLLFGLPITFGYFFSPKMYFKIRKAIKEKQYDLYFAFCSSTAQYFLPFREAKFVVDFVDVDSEKWAQYSKYSSLIKKLIYRREARILKKWEKIIHSRAIRSIVTTQREKAKLLGLDYKKEDEALVSEVNSVSVVTSGIDYASYQCIRTLSIEPMLVFTGQMDYLPNLDAVIYFYLNIWPYITAEVPNASFYIVGRNSPATLREVCSHAIITGEVLDVRPYLQQARVFIAPLRLAFGVQTKVAEAMAAGLPVVATSSVLDGLFRAEAQKHLLVADDPREFAKCVISLLKDEDLNRAIAKAGNEYVREYQSQDKTAEQLEREIDSLVL